MHATTEAGSVPSLARPVATVLAANETAQMVHMLRSLEPDDWTRPTACPAWVVQHRVGRARCAHRPRGRPASGRLHAGQGVDSAWHEGHRLLHTARRPPRLELHDRPDVRPAVRQRLAEGAVVDATGIPVRGWWACLDARRHVCVRPDAAGRRQAARRVALAVPRVRRGDDHRPDRCRTGHVRTHAGRFAGAGASASACSCVAPAWRRASAAMGGPGDSARRGPTIPVKVWSASC